MDSKRSLDSIEIEVEHEAKRIEPYQSNEQDLKRWAAKRNMVPIGEGCYRTIPSINKE